MWKGCFRTRKHSLCGFLMENMLLSYSILHFLYELFEVTFCYEKCAQSLQSDKKNKPVKKFPTGSFYNYILSAKLQLS